MLVAETALLKSLTADSWSFTSGLLVCQIARPVEKAILTFTVYLASARGTCVLSDLNTSNFRGRLILDI